MLGENRVDRIFSKVYNFVYPIDSTLILMSFIFPNSRPHAAIVEPVVTISSTIRMCFPSSWSVF